MEVIEYAKMNHKKWLKYLYSDKGLFKRHNGAAQIVGPSVTDDGSITGDVFSMETMTFGMKCSPEQMDFYQALLKENEVRAQEYLLVMIEALDKWKDDMVKIQNFIDSVEKGEKIIEYEEDILKLENDISGVSDNPVETVKSVMKHFPGIVGNGFDLGRFLNTSTLDEVREYGVKKYLDVLKSAEKTLKDKVKHLKDYVDQQKRIRPFLFE